MAVGLKAPAGINAIAGIQLASSSAGIYSRKSRDDMVLFSIVSGSAAACVFTRNKFCAAPVTVAKQHLENARPRYLLINAGNANAGTGKKGINDALTLCQALADIGDCDVTEVIPFSTGVIGEYLPVPRMTETLNSLIQKLDENNWLKCAEAIMTTDTVAKAQTVQCKVGGKTVSFTGIAKGAGMIRPDMATMLAFIMTDANIDEVLLNEALKAAVNESFNRITIDGDTSTNDACTLIATKRAGNAVISNKDSSDYVEFYLGLQEICCRLAQSIVRDGEGATKFVTINVEGGVAANDCLAVAYRIAHSPLVKTALTASDANWGRILAAVGSAGAEHIDIDKVNIFLGDVCIVKNGQREENYTEEQGKQLMQRSEITIRVDLQLGDAKETVWTTDLSYEYIKINAEYRT